MGTKCRSNVQQLPQLTYDTRKMNEDISIIDALALYANIYTNNQSNNIRCPSPEHIEKNPSAHIYSKDNICKCFSCGRKLNPISLAKEYNPQLPFRELCKKMINDFNMNIYNYSNLGEIEKIQTANKSNKFYDYFPITEKDLKFIGINNPTGREECTYTVKASEYYIKLLGEIPPFAQTHDENGKDLLINCNRSEAIRLGIISQNERKNDFIKFPTVQQLWEKDKYNIEEMVINKCYECMELINQTITGMQLQVEQYRKEHDVNNIKEAERIREGYINAMSSGKLVRLSEKQEGKISGLNEFEVNKDTIRFLNCELNNADKILQKVILHGKEREKAQKKEKKQQWGKECR